MIFQLSIAPWLKIIDPEYRDHHSGNTRATVNDCSSGELSSPNGAQCGASAKSRASVFEKWVLPALLLVGLITLALLILLQWSCPALVTGSTLSTICGFSFPTSLCLILAGRIPMGPGALARLMHLYRYCTGIRELPRATLPHCTVLAWQTTIGRVPKIRINYIILV